MSNDLVLVEKNDEKTNSTNGKRRGAILLGTLLGIGLGAVIYNTTKDNDETTED